MAGDGAVAFGQAEVAARLQEGSVSPGAAEFPWESRRPFPPCRATTDRGPLLLAGGAEREVFAAAGSTQTGPPRPWTPSPGRNGRARRCRRGGWEGLSAPGPYLGRQLRARLAPAERRRGNPPHPGRGSRRHPPPLKARRVSAASASSPGAAWRRAAGHPPAHRQAREPPRRRAGPGGAGPGRRRKRRRRRQGGARALLPGKGGG